MMALDPHVFQDPPAAGDFRGIAEGVFWVRLFLPFKLDHVNLWLLDDGDGWTVFDTGMDVPDARAAWGDLLGGLLAGRPLRRMIVTHFHPDHLGLAGWLRDRTGAELWMSALEWNAARSLTVGDDAKKRAEAIDFYRYVGAGDAAVALSEQKERMYAPRVSPIPEGFRRIVDGETLNVGGRDWQAMVGRGHSPEGLAFYCRDLGVLISGDHILGNVSPNVSVWPRQHEVNPLRLYLDSLPPFGALPAETLVLPGHDLPFSDLPGRVEVLSHHHAARLAETLDSCREPATAWEVLKQLFRSGLDEEHMVLAAGETLAHLHFLIGQRKLIRLRTTESVKYVVKT